MPDHESTRGDEPSLTPPPGTEPNTDDQAHATRRLPRFNLAAISASLPRFGRRKGATAEAGGEAATSTDEGSAVAPEPGASARRFPRIAWHKLPLANARRETRVGVAALASFLILVGALVLNRVTRKDDKPADAAASGTLLALNASDEGGKEKGSEPAAKSDPVPPPKEPVEKPSTEPAEKPSTRRTDPAKAKPPEDTTPPPPSLPAPPAEALPAMSSPSPANDVAVAPPTNPRADTAPAKPPEEPIVRPQPATASTKPADPPPNPLAVDTPPALPTPGPAPVSEDLPSMPSTAPPVAGPAIEPPSIAPATPDPKNAPKPAEPIVEPLPAPAAAPLDPFPASDPPPAPVPEPATRAITPETRPRNDPAPHPLPEPTAVEPKATGTPPPTRPDPVTSTPAVAPEPRPAAKLPAFTKPPIESEPADAAAALPPGGRLVHSLGKRRMPDPEPQARLAPERTVPDAPLPREEVGARDREDPILHVVDSGENFWTISRTYYGSGRYYQALHAANRRLVPKIDELYVGTTIKVPPVEALDPTLIDPPSRSADAAATRASRSPTPVRPRSSDDGRSVPTRTRGEVARGLPSSRARDVDEPTRPTYRVRAHDTLRSIARDTLGDPHRYREILDLNRDALDDGGRLVPGVTLTLPEDAAVRDR